MALPRMKDGCEETSPWPLAISPWLWRSLRWSLSRVPRGNPAPEKQFQGGCSREAAFIGHRDLSLAFEVNYKSAKNITGLGFPRPGLCLSPPCLAISPENASRIVFERDHLGSAPAPAQEYLGNAEPVLSTGSWLLALGRYTKPPAHRLKTDPSLRSGFRPSTRPLSRGHLEGRLCGLPPALRDHARKTAQVTQLRNS
jgi:hypothetical protein